MDENSVNEDFTEMAMLWEISRYGLVTISTVENECPARQYHSSLAVIIRLKASQGPQEYVVCYGPGRQALDAD